MTKQKVTCLSIGCPCHKGGECESGEKVIEIMNTNWHDAYPLNTFTGRTKEELIQFIDAHFFPRSKVKEVIESFQNTKEHICRFNDGENSCECYNITLTELLNKLGL